MFDDKMDLTTDRGESSLKPTPPFNTQNARIYDNEKKDTEYAVR